jgi:hypothetical protein
MNIEIIKIIKCGVKIHEKNQNKYFIVEYPEKFDHIGFELYDAKYVIHNKLIKNQFTFSYFKTLILHFTVLNDKKKYIYDIICEEYIKK